MIIVMIDICSVHGSEKALPTLSCIEIYFLPPNTTSKNQPLDAGIIAQIKRNCRRPLLLRLFQNSGTEKKSVYNVDKLTAMW